MFKGVRRKLDFSSGGGVESSEPCDFKFVMSHTHECKSEMELQRMLQATFSVFEISIDKQGDKIVPMLTAVAPVAGEGLRLQLGCPGSGRAKRLLLQHYDSLCATCVSVERCLGSGRLLHFCFTVALEETRVYLRLEE
ncbi:uncharacterized protein LOC144728036 [Lampetra planeri]